MRDTRRERDWGLLVDVNDDVADRDRARPSRDRLAVTDIPDYDVVATNQRYALSGQYAERLSESRLGQTAAGLLRRQAGITQAHEDLREDGNVGMQLSRKLRLQRGCDVVHGRHCWSCFTNDKPSHHALVAC